MGAGDSQGSRWVCGGFAQWAGRARDRARQDAEQATRCDRGLQFRAVLHHDRAGVVMFIPKREAELEALFAKHFSNNHNEPSGANGQRQYSKVDLADDEIIAKVRKAKNSAKFERLFDHGDISEYDNDDDDDAAPANVVWLHQVKDPGPRRFLVEEVVPEKYPTVIYGGGGTMKSLIAL